MKLNSKIDAFTLSEMIVVLILTSIVVGLAFSVLTLVQKHMAAIQHNLEQATELHKLEQSLWLDFNRFSNISYNTLENQLVFESVLDTVTYSVHEQNITKGLDTFNVQLNSKVLYFNGKEINSGKMDAIKLETSKEFQNQHLFIFKKNDGAQFMN